MATTKTNLKTARAAKAESEPAPTPVVPALDNPLAEIEETAKGETKPLGPYDLAVQQGEELRQRPYSAATTLQVLRQHAKGRMTVWERIEVLQDKDVTPVVRSSDTASS